MTTAVLSMLRADRATLREPTVDADGTIRGEMVIGTVGLQSYGSRVERVTADALQDEATKRTAAMRPIVRVPNSVHWGKITPDNIRQWRIGSTGSAVRFDGENLIVDYAIDTREGIDLVRRKGLREISASYSLTSTGPGGVTEDGKRFDLEQGPRDQNHFALVDKGRIGATGSLRADGGLMDPEQIAELKIKHAELERKLADATGQIATVTAASEAATAFAAAETVRADAAEAKAATLIDPAVVRAGDGPDFLAGFNTRAAVVKRADGIADAPTMDTTKLRRAVVASVRKDLRADASEDYVTAAFDMLPEPATAKGGQWAGLRGPSKPAPNRRADSAPVVAFNPFAQRTAAKES